MIWSNIIAGFFLGVGIALGIWVVNSILSRYNLL
jgi:hypothetical protein